MPGSTAGADSATGSPSTSHSTAGWAPCQRTANDTLVVGPATRPWASTPVPRHAGRDAVGEQACRRAAAAVRPRQRRADPSLRPAATGDDGRPATMRATSRRARCSPAAARTTVAAASAASASHPSCGRAVPRPPRRPAPPRPARRRPAHPCAPARPRRRGSRQRRHRGRRADRARARTAPPRRRRPPLCRGGPAGWPAGERPTHPRATAAASGRRSGRRPPPRRGVGQRRRSRWPGGRWAARLWWLPAGRCRGSGRSSAAEPCAGRPW